MFSSFDLSLLPTVNAFLNSASALTLIIGYVAIRKKKREFHKKCMILALIFSGVFLMSYLTYHFFHPTTRFPDLGWIKILYLFILFTHVVLAVVMLPFIGLTFYRAFKGDDLGHKKVARWTFPVWLYVSITGVVIYLMLYVFFVGPA